MPRDATLAWDQDVLPGTDLATYHFAIYVDGVRSDLAGATCDPAAEHALHECRAPLPALERGPHVVTIAATCEFRQARREGRQAIPIVITIP